MICLVNGTDLTRIVILLLILFIDVQNTISLMVTNIYCFLDTQIYVQISLASQTVPSISIEAEKIQMLQLVF